MVVENVVAVKGLPFLAWNSSWRFEELQITKKNCCWFLLLLLFSISTWIIFQWQIFFYGHLFTFSYSYNIHNVLCVSLNFLNKFKLGLSAFFKIFIFIIFLYFYFILRFWFHYINSISCCCSRALLWWPPLWVDRL